MVAATKRSGWPKNCTNWGRTKQIVLQSSKVQRNCIVDTILTVFREDLYSQHVNAPFNLIASVKLMQGQLQTNNLLVDHSRERAQFGRFKNGHGHKGGLRVIIYPPCSLFSLQSATFLKGCDWWQGKLFIFIGPESDHCLPLSLTHSLTDSLLFSKLDWCFPGVWRYQLKTSWCCYCCWCW